MLAIIFCICPESRYQSGLVCFPATTACRPRGKPRRLLATGEALLPCAPLMQLFAQLSWHMLNKQRLAYASLVQIAFQFFGCGDAPHGDSRALGVSWGLTFRLGAKRDNLLRCRVDSGVVRSEDRGQPLCSREGRTRAVALVSDGLRSEATLRS